MDRASTRIQKIKNTMEECKLKDAMAIANERLSTHGVVVNGGKKYLMVKDRVSIFRETYDTDYGIETQVVEATHDRCIIQCKIVDDNGLTIGSGIAEEIRSDRGVNSTSAVENAETSAIGRALASLGLHGGEYASADELAGALERRGDVEDGNTGKSTDGPILWQTAKIPYGKNKGKTLGECEESYIKWLYEKHEANPQYKDSQELRDALDQWADPSSTTEQIGDEPIDEIAEQTADDPTDPELDEDVPF